jgi:hypothetical protein
MTHLIDDETVAKMGHPVVVVRSDVGHPPDLCLPDAYGWEGRRTVLAVRLSSVAMQRHFPDVLVFWF